MSHRKLKFQKGYLMIISPIIIVLVALVATFTTGMLSGGIKSGGNVYQSKAAFYLADSALQIAKRDVLVNSKPLLDINGDSLYTVASLPDVYGQYTVKAAHSKADAKLNANITNNATTIVLKDYSNTSNSLNGSINETATTITLSDASSFNPRGTVKIGNEYISYTDKSGNNLTNVTRGVVGTTAATHSSSATVSQGFFEPTTDTDGIIKIGNEMISYKQISENAGLLTLQNATRGIGGTTAVAHSLDDIVYQYQGILTSTAALPDFTDPEAKSIIQESIWYDDSEVLIINGFKPTLVSLDNVKPEDDAVVQNMNVSSTDPDFAGSTILTSDEVDFDGNDAHTQYIDGQSNENNINADIQQNSPSLSPLFSKIFNQSFNDIQNMATITISPSQFASTSMGPNDIVRVTGDLILENGSDISKAPNVIIINGKFTIYDDNHHHHGGGGINVYIGTSSNPTIVIVEDELKIETESNKQFLMYGLMYVMGDDETKIKGNSSTINGFVATEGETRLEDYALISRDQSVINLLKNTELLVTSATSENIPNQQKEVFN